ncbi:MAG: MotA/TolQ/ExbB proton channel family protein [Prevotellaceae bacterium]|jgi:biopolymer transport protein ExbB|nr:MotA/TolQ/ExbB proton channel family protein [Prevotellaceae bacterium]
MKFRRYTFALVTAFFMVTLSGFAQQATEELPQQDATAFVETVNEQDGISVWELTLKGGWLMFPLILLSFIAVYIFFERWVVIQKTTRIDPRFMSQIADYIRESRIDAARALCRHENTPIGRMVDKGISSLGRPLADIREAVENTGNLEIARLERGLPILATISGGAPMLGFLGTVIGMVQAFYNMAASGSGTINMSMLSGGIYTAMITTVAGLIVAILAYFGYNYLTTIVKNFVNKLQKNTIDFIDILNEPVKQ